MFNDSFSPVCYDYTEFWGTKIDSDSRRDLKEAFAIHIVMACIDLNEARPQPGSKPLKAGLYLEKENERYKICHLNQDWLQQPINLVFEETLGIRLLVVGNTPIYIYGYRIKEDRFFVKSDGAVSSHSSPHLDGSGLGMYSHIIDTTCYTISDGDSKDSSQDSKSQSPPSESLMSNVDDDYTSESTARSESLGSATSSESSKKRKRSRKKSDKTD